MYQLAELGLEAFYLLGASVYISGPLALIMPFLWKTKKPTSQKFSALMFTLLLIFIGTLPLMWVFSYVPQPALNYIKENTNKQTHLDNPWSFALFSFGASVSICCLISLWVQKRMLSSKEPKEFSKSNPTT